MAIIIKTCLPDGAIPEYICSLCYDVEDGGLRGAAYIHKSLKPVITQTNVESREWWENNISSGLILIIPKTRGTFDGGAKQTVTGFGDEKELVTKKIFTAVVNDRNYKGNVDFYEMLENNFSNYLFCFRTGSILYIASNAITGIEVKNNVEEDTASMVLWQATITWEQKRPKMIVPQYEPGDDVIELFTGCAEEVEP